MQYPNDEKDGEPREVCRIVHFELDAASVSALADRAAGVMRKLVGLEGFREGRVFESDGGTAVIIMSCWKTRHAWAQAQWQKEVGDFLADCTQAGLKFKDIFCYERATVLPNDSK